MSARSDAGSVIDVWLADYRAFDDEALLARLRSILTPQERAQEPRFQFADDRRRYLVTRALLRGALSRYAPVAPRDWTFEHNRYGRPSIASCHHEAAGLGFNLSHTRGLIALAVAWGTELGIDVENVTTRQLSTGIAHRYFAATETAALIALPPEQQPQRLFELWTLKEAYIKARGMGLSLPLERFAFGLDIPGSVTLSIDPSLADDPARWHLWQYQPLPGFMLALCARRAGESVPEVVFRTRAPGGEATRLEVSPARTSPPCHDMALA